MRWRILYVLFVFALLFALFSNCASAEEADVTDEIMDEFSSIIPEESGVSVGDELLDDVGFEALFLGIMEVISNTWGDVLGFFMMLMGLCVIMALCEGAYVTDNPLLRKNVSAAVAAIASVSIFSSLYGIIEMVRESLLSIADFFSSLIPIVVLVNSSSGSVSTAAVQATNMNITLAVVQKFCTGAILPLVFGLFSLALTASLGEGSAASVARGIKNAFMWGIGIICTVLATSVALQSLLASAKDTAALRAARYAASGMIPIVGSSVASALGTLAGGLAFIKSTVGVGAIAVIVALALAPLVSMLLYRLSFSVGIIFLDLLGVDSGARCFSAFRSAVDALCAVYSLSVLICIIQLMVFLRSGVVVA